MSQQFHRVSIAGTGSFLPGDPIPNDRLREVLGPLEDAPDRINSFVDTVAAKMLANSGVEQRHFAIEPGTQNLTHTVAGLAEVAVRRALDAAGKQPEDVDLLLISSPSFDHTTPPTSVMLQEKLGIETCAEMEIHSNCSGVGKCVQIAYDALRCGRYKNAVVVYSQLSSVYLRSCYYNQPKINKKQAALRYILADGAGALFMESVPPGDEPLAHEMLGTFVESVGGKEPPGMTAGGGVADLMGCHDPVPHVYAEGKHHLDQDFAAVNRHAGRVLFEGMVKMAETLDIPAKDVDSIVVSIPTKQLYEDNLKRFSEHFCRISDKQFRFRGSKTGYCGGASILLHFDEMVRDNELKPGQIVLVDSVESSKWMTAGFAVRW